MPTISPSATPIADTTSIPTRYRLTLLHSSSPSSSSFIRQK